MKRFLFILGLCLLSVAAYGQRKGNIIQRKETFIDIRERLGLNAAIVKKNTVPVPALWQRTVEARECDELLVLPDGNLLLGTVDLRSKTKSLIGGALTGHGVYALFPNYSTLYKVDARTGAILWTHKRTGEMGTAVYGFVDISDDALVMQESTGKKEYLLQLDIASGKELWRSEIGLNSKCHGMAGEILVFHMSDKEVLNYTSYSLQGKKQLYSRSAGKVSGDYLTVGFGDGMIAVIDSTACRLIDAASGDMAERTPAASEYVNFYATPASLLLIAANGDCIMLDSRGNELWNISAGAPPMFCDEWDEYIYWVTYDGGVAELSAMTKCSGERLWSCALDGPVAGSITVHDGTLALTTVPSLWFIDMGTGKPVKQIGVPVAKERIPDLIQQRNDKWIVTYQTAVECYDNTFVKQWEYNIGPFVRTAEEPGIPDAVDEAGVNPMHGMANFQISMFSMQQSVNQDYANYLKYGKFNPTSNDSPTSIAGFRQGIKAEKQAAGFALAGAAATAGAALYFDIMARKAKAEYDKADLLRDIYTYRLSRRETGATNQGDYYIRRFETARSRNLLVVNLNDGRWAEIVLGPRETADVEEYALLNTCLYVYHPEEEMIVANGIGLEPSKWETTEINKTSTVKSSLLSFRISDMNFRAYDEYADNTIAK